MRFYFGRLTIIILAFGASLHANTILFGLLGDPNQNYSFNRTDSPAGASVSDPVGPYAGWLGANIPADRFGFFCIDYAKGASWNTSYTGTLYHVTDAVPNKTTAQLVEAAYLANKLYWLGGNNASTSLYQGPISFAVWQIMDPTPGHVPRDPAAQQYVLEAQNAYNSHLITAAMFPNIKIFVPDNPSIQDFMSVEAAAPEPESVAMLLGGLGLIAVGLIRRPARKPAPDHQ